MLSLFSFDQKFFRIFRILLGLFLIFYLIQRMTDLSLHYTDEGVLTIERANELLNIWSPSIHSLNGSFHFQAGMFVLQILCALLLLQWKHLRGVIFLNWFLLNSLYFRNPLVNDAGDSILLLILFWMIFLPSKLITESKESGQTVVSVFNVGLILQILGIYFFSAILKIQNDWISGNNGIYYAFITHSSTFTQTIAKNIPKEVFTLLSILVVLFELIAPIIFLSPLNRTMRRKIIPWLFIIFHIFVALFFDIWRFAIFCMIMWILVLGHDHTKNKNEIIEFLKTPLEKIKFLFYSIFILTIMLANLHSVGVIPNQLISFFNPIINPLQLHQNWNMFTNPLLKVEQNWSINGLTKQGDRINLIEKNEPLLRMNQRWENYLTQIKYNGTEKDFKNLAKSLCKIDEFEKIEITVTEVDHAEGSKKLTLNTNYSSDCKKKALTKSAPKT